jgi:hypothetical protein
MEPLGKSGLVETGDILSVYYGDKHNIYSTTYDAKVNISSFTFLTLI